MSKSHVTSQVGEGGERRRALGDHARYHATLVLGERGLRGELGVAALALLPPKHDFFGKNFRTRASQMAGKKPKQQRYAGGRVRADVHFRNKKLDTLNAGR